jgi:quercetin dioxygenase-like cupin family protein
VELLEKAAKRGIARSTAARRHQAHGPSARPLAGAGWEIRQTLVEIPEGIASGRHSHPGPEVGYIVRGEVSMEFDDGTPLALRTGDPFLIPPGVIHNARNVGTVTTKMLSTYFVDETQTLVTLY